MSNIGIIIDTLQGGGAERCAADLSVYFCGEGYGVYIITNISMGIGYEYSGMLINFNFSFFSANRRGDNPLADKVDELREIKNKYKIDIAISFMQFANYLNILSKENEKVILTTHSINSEYARYKKDVYWSEQTFRDLYQYADVITFPSEYCRNDWIAHFGDKNRITKTVYNPVHLMKVKEKENKDNIVIAIGRMHGVKRQWHLIRAFKLVKDGCPDSKLIILGDGELRPKLTRLVVELGLENNVEMPGNVQNVADYLAEAKVFAITSRCEAMPCAVLEAMSAGVPIVACDIPGGIREELGLANAAEEKEYPLQGDCGIITPYIEEFAEDDFSREEKCLADEILHLLRDDQLRHCMAINAARKAELFLPETIGSVWVKDIFQNCLNRVINREDFEELRKKSINEFKKDGAVNEAMYITYYRLLERWMALRDSQKGVRLYLEKQGIKKIIIYGMGKMANHLIADLDNSNIEIVCAIDRAAIDKYGDFPIITGDQFIPDADCMIITPVYDFKAIEEEMMKKTKIPLISLEEIVYKSM